MNKVIQPFYTAWVIVTFLCGLLSASPLFFIIGVWDNPKARRTIWMLVRLWSRLWMLVVGMPVRIVGNKPNNSKYVYVGNHISYLDILAVYAVVPNYFRTLGKIELSRIPIFGFVYKQLAILVDRSSAFSRNKSMRLMWLILNKESNICVFPEGTFNETGQPLKEFYNGAFRLAINAQKPVLPFILVDTVDRWHYSAWWKISPGKNRVVFLDPVSVEGMTMDDLGALRDDVHQRMTKALETYKRNS